MINSGCYDLPQRGCFPRLGHNKTGRSKREEWYQEQQKVRFIIVFGNFILQRPYLSMIIKMINYLIYIQFF